MNGYRNTLVWKKLINYSNITLFILFNTISDYYIQSQFG